MPSMGAGGACARRRRVATGPVCVEKPSPRPLWGDVVDDDEDDDEDEDEDDDEDGNDDETVVMFWEEVMRGDD